MNYPEEQFNKELELLAKTSEAMEPNALFAQSSKERLMAKIVQHPVTKPAKVRILKRKTKELIAAFTILTTIILSTSGVSAAYDSLPGDTLYPVRQVLEEIEIKTAKNDRIKAVRHLEHAKARLKKVESVLAAGNEEVSDDLQKDAELAVQKAIDLDVEDHNLTKFNQLLLSEKDHMNKKAIVGAMLGAMLIVSPVAAQDDEPILDEILEESQPEEEAGIGPDSPFYFLDSWGEAIRLALTFDGEKKAELRLKYAEEKLAELLELDPEEVEKLEIAIKRYENHIFAAQQGLKNLDKEKKEKLAERLADRADHHQDVLDRIHDRAADKAKDRVEKARDKAEKHRQDALDRLAETDPERAARLLEKQAERELKKAEREAERDARKAERELERHIRQLEHAEDLAGRAADEGIDVSDIIDANRQRHLDRLEEVRDRVPEQAREALDKVIDRARDRRDELRNRFEENKARIQERREDRRDELRDRAEDDDSDENDENNDDDDTDDVDDENDENNDDGDENDVDGTDATNDVV